MTKTSMTPLLLACTIACALALSACGKQESAEAGHEPAHASSSAGLPDGDAAAGKALATRKGASGQAIQNMNLIMGLPETTGLMMPPMYP